MFLMQVDLLLSCGFSFSSREIISLGLFHCRRWLRIFEGELHYYKPDDLEVL